LSKNGIRILSCFVNIIIEVFGWINPLWNDLAFYLFDAFLKVFNAGQLVGLFL
jgi:hypothetical protein